MSRPGDIVNDLRNAASIFRERGMAITAQVIEDGANELVAHKAAVADPLLTAHEAPTYRVLATFDGDQEVWWCDEPWEGARTDIGGGQVVGDVPLALWQEYSAALATMSRTRAALSDALGLHPKEMMLAEACSSYQGEELSVGSWRHWCDCEACGWPKDDHA